MSGKQLLCGFEPQITVLQTSSLTTWIQEHFEWDEKVSNLHPLDFQSSATDLISYHPILMAQF